MQKLPGDYHIVVQMISLSANACLIWNVNVLVSMSGCDPDLFEYVLKLRKRRIDLEELLTEKKRSSDALKRKCDFLTEKVVPSGFLSYLINRHVSFTHYPFFLTFWCACFICYVWASTRKNCQRAVSEQQKMTWSYFSKRISRK